MKIIMSVDHFILSLQMDTRINYTYVSSHDCGIDRNDTVLDFGCAKGYVTYGLRLLGCNAHGVDISKYSISKERN